MICIFLPRILSVPENHWRLARMTGMTPRDQFRYIEWPAIRAMITPMMVLVFLFCFSSFSLVLMLQRWKWRFMPLSVSHMIFIWRSCSPRCRLLLR
jgi:ABC-type Fe3+ transport system permease subunit